MAYIRGLVVFYFTARARVADWFAEARVAAEQRTADRRVAAGWRFIETRPTFEPPGAVSTAELRAKVRSTSAG